MPESIFGQIFSQDHLKILRNCIKEHYNPGLMDVSVILFRHQNLCPAVEQWIMNLKKMINKKKILPDILGWISIWQVLFDL